MNSNIILLIFIINIIVIINANIYSPQLNVKDYPAPAPSSSSSSSSSSTNIIYKNNNNKKKNTLKVTDFSPIVGGVGTWLYIHGDGFIADETMVQFLPDDTYYKAITYNSQSLGITVPQTNMTVNQIKVTVNNNTATAPQPYIIALASQPPSVNDLYSNSGPIGCYNYLHGENFVIDKTQVKFDNLVLPIVYYSHNSIGFTVTKQMSCLDNAYTDGIPVTVTTPYGTITSSFKFKIIQKSCDDCFC